MEHCNLNIILRGNDLMDLNYIFNKKKIKGKLIRFSLFLVIFSTFFSNSVVNVMASTSTEEYHPIEETGLSHDLIANGDNFVTTADTITVTLENDRHAKVNDDVFLGGKYIELGVNKFGYFGTSSIAPTGFHPLANYGNRLGMQVDGDGFDNGNPPTTGDFFLPGSPFEGFVVSYKNEAGQVTTQMNANAFGTQITTISTEDTSSEEELSAQTTATTTDGKLELKQTVSFRPADKFIKLMILYKNISEETLYDARYMRKVDPDQDLDLKGTYETLNSVPNNPSEINNKAIVISKGAVSNEPLIYYANDKRARASISTSTDPYSDYNFNVDGSQLLKAESKADTHIAMTFALGDIKPNETATAIFYISLDPNVDSALENLEEEVPADPVKSNNADLESISINHAVLNEVFAPEIMDYTATVASNIDSLLINASKADEKATVEFKKDSLVVANPIPLKVGQNIIEITITAEDGTEKTYKITILRKTPSNGGSSSADQTQTITAPVETSNGDTASEVTIIRTTNIHNRLKDEVTLTSESVKKTIEAIADAGKKIARIVMPDGKDEVSEVNINLPSTATRQLANNHVDLEIITDNAKIMIPSSSIEGLQNDVYFHLVPIKEKEKQKEVEERAKKEEVVKIALGDGNANVVGRPMEIETNMQSRPVTLVLPLQDVVIPTKIEEREKFLADLVIFIEHSDGEKELVKPEVVEYKNGQLGLEFKIDKFSTFTILNMENWEEYLVEQEAKKLTQQSGEEGSHYAYMNGYPDGTFKPAKSITRSEMAAILQRLRGNDLTNEKQGKFPDVTDKHWAKNVIQFASANGLMNGYQDGSFKPEGNITRAEMAAVISRQASLEGNPTHSFIDVNGHWASVNIAQVGHAGYMGGYPDGSFKPNQELTRAEAVAIFNRVMKRGPLLGVETATWKDVPTTNWAFKDIEEASKTHSFIIVEQGKEQLVK